MLAYPCSYPEFTTYVGTDVVRWHGFRDYSEVQSQQGAYD